MPRAAVDPWEQQYAAETPPSPAGNTLGLISQYESGDRNVPNYRFDPGHTAQGYYQITNTNWNHIAPLVGIDTATYPNAMSAPQDVQAKVANYLLTQTPAGIRNWTDYNPRLRAALGAAPAQGSADRSVDTATVPAPIPTAADSGSVDMLGRIARGESVEVTPEDILKIAFGPTGVQIARTSAPQPQAGTPAPAVTRDPWEQQYASAPPLPSKGDQPYNFPKPTYKSSLPWPLNRMDEAVDDSINWMADGIMRAKKAETVDEKLAGVSEILRGFFNTAGAPLVLQGLGTPVRTALGLAAGVGTQKAAEHVLPKLGAGPGTTMAGGDVAGILAGIGASKASPGDVAAAAKGGITGAYEAATETVPLKKLGINISVPKVAVSGAAGGTAAAGMGLPRTAGAVVGAVAPIIKGAVTGARTALAERAAGVPPGVLTPEQAGMVKAAQAAKWTPEEQALAGTIFENVAPETPPAAPPLTPQELTELETGRPPSRQSEAAQQAATETLATARAAETPPAAPQAAPAAPEASAATQEPPVAPIEPSAPQTPQPASAVQKLTDYVIGKKVPLQQLETTTPEYWKMYADDAGTTFPTKDEIAQIKANVAAQEVPQGEQTFQEQKARGEETMTPPKKTPPPAAPPAGGVLMEPLPENIPPHYLEHYTKQGLTVTERDFAKDLRIADYVLAKKRPNGTVGYTPEEFQALPLAEQNKLIREAPTASGRGKHYDYLEDPGPGKGRPAAVGIRHIADTMRWRQAQMPAAAPEAATIPTEGIETPAQGKAAFEAQQAMPAPAKRTRRAKPKS